MMRSVAARAAAFAVVLVVISPGSLDAQVLLKVNILRYFNQVPPPPLTARDAFARCVFNQDSTGVLLGSAYKSIDETEKQLETRLQSILMQLQPPMTDKVKNMDQKEIEKKMEAMSQDEKIKYAMELSKQMGLGPKMLAPESPNVNAAVEAATNLNGAMGEDLQGMGAQIQAQAARDAKVNQQHDAIDTWERDEEQKLPQINYGEMSAPEPKAYRDLMLRTADKHIVVAGEALKSAASDFRAALEKGLTMYGPFEEKLEAVHYGEDAKNVETKRILVNGQSFMLQSLAKLIGISKDATTTAARWYFARWKAEQLPVK
jgi:hypothetical protein